MILDSILNFIGVLIKTVNGTILAFKIIIFVIIALAVIKVLLIILTYVRSLKSRSYYKCFDCNNVFKTEYADAEYCSACGGKVYKIKDSEITKIKGEYNA